MNISFKSNIKNNLKKEFKEFKIKIMNIIYYNILLLKRLNFKILSIFL